MAKFSTNTSRTDPYKNFKFRLKWDGNYIPAITNVSGLLRTTELADPKVGDTPAPNRGPIGRTKYEPITLQRGITHDTSFEDWANLAMKQGATPASAAATTGVKKDVTIELYNEAGQLMLAYTVHGCWPSEYGALPNLGADANAIAIEHIKLENEGWDRDTSIPPPSNP
jgi:phage tail-like protein